MPSYDYECRRCGARFDEIVQVSERDLPVACPDCGGDAKRLVCAPSFVCGDTKDWSSENNGKGRRISQLDHGIRQPYYAKSQSAAIDEAKRRNLEVTRA